MSEQDDELLALESIYGLDGCYEAIEASHCRIKVLTPETPEVYFTLDFRLPPTYPADAIPEMDIALHQHKRGAMPDSVRDPILLLLRDKAQENLGNPTLYELVELFRENAARLVTECDSFQTVFLKPSH
eukprot:TRINITY_DN156_c0_g1_i2.p1 TRINITY_DN156_c0_g1~~TRINITY_DN156_c0_g1_i2.p1  ORF type:complete len:140 (+),score=15.75 TRINITY_DN156_c0_g1_i2:35-421(+)